MTKRKLPICVRPNCTRAQPGNNDYDGLCFYHAKAAGIAHHFVPWEKLNAELERLTNGGWTLNAIEEDYIVFNNTLRDIKYHRRARFRHSTYQALKEIPTLSPYRRPAWPLRRRVNTMRAIGITFVEIGEEIGEKAATVQHLSYDRAQWATPELDEKIRAYYTKHADDPVREIDGKTKKLNLPRPFDWDDIDNPHEHARASLRTSGDTKKRQPITPEFLNKLEFLVSYYGINKAASVIGINAKTINRIRQEQSQHTNEKVTLRIEDSYDELRIRGGQAA
ncbi:hypothetical protein QP976_00980 [Corynebacterium striatum]|uniref:hypothetical protein n=1 Tax=Corynebacterium striatum TaxID=43770 RepID=UPI00254EBF46|nr:hypothetical protein [Corynebacterium striatum]MDK8811571.1 hypothetical protein [Corynebacterium striatum]